ADRMLGEGKDVDDVCRELQVSEQTYYRWRNQFGGLKADDIARAATRHQRSMPPPAPTDDDQLTTDVGDRRHARDAQGIVVDGSQEHPEQMTDRDDFLAWVQGALYKAEVALHNGDPGPRRALWSRNEPVSVLGAWRNAVGQREVDDLFAFLGN